MTPYLGCESARELLEAFADGELAMAEQVAVENHLRWCRTCRARVEDLHVIGASLRVGARRLPHEAVDDHELTAIQAGVLSRLDAERTLSIGVRIRELFEDARLFWPAVGATSAVAACLCAALVVFQAATAENPESLSAMLERLERPGAPELPPANPGSDQNPMRLDGRVSFPRALSSIPALETTPEDEVAFAVAAVVTREGRIANYDLLQAERVSRQRPYAQTSDDQDAVLDVVRGSRFTPAEAAGGTKVAVNMVWLLVRTTARVRPVRVTASTVVSAPAPPPLDPIVAPDAAPELEPDVEPAPEPPPAASTTA
jgi:hypothetical protein